ncbi:hypothetical protein QQS21_001046 [Conoideocrella luteorostrata]|uniref:GTP cyclohydrolase II n=1 Tax=Conoideocrella luteorostrata TaxID=1105319 RepID=A0AAJ0D0E1_9HYPO|nr:hypothetical protein QQS21_001046 [Conoideocrella luteorostrata]
MTPTSSDAAVLDALRQIQQSQAQLSTAVEYLTGGLSADESNAPTDSQPPALADQLGFDASYATSASMVRTQDLNDNTTPTPNLGSRSGFTSRIVLTTYPKQIGIDPLAMDWGNPDPLKRGPVVVSRSSSTIRRRNEPAAQIGPFPHWGDPRKIVAMDPWGHLTPWIFKDLLNREHVDLRPTIAITKAHMRLPELEDSVKKGRLIPDGKVCLNELGELAVTKFAVEPVWYLPGVAERFGIDEGTLRRSLFEHTGGSYPELITRGDIKVFLPPIGGLTVYCFGDPEKMSDENVRLSLRIHDECNGSDVFGSDICTCRPYLIFGIEEAVKEAQNGGSGVVIYFRKEGRALGEVTKVRLI